VLTRLLSLQESDSMRAKIILVLLSPLLLLGCGSVDLASFLPWGDSSPKVAAADNTALRGDDALATPPDGMQVEDLRVPFGDAPQTSAALADARSTDSGRIRPPG
jgi:hypothetical protein